MNKLSLADLDVNGQRVLMRVDFNVPIDKNGRITDDSRIRAALPSIKYVIDHGGILVLMSHLGRPDGKRVPSLSLEVCAQRLSKLLDGTVLFQSDCIGPAVENAVKNVRKGGVILLENLRFHNGEEHPDQDPSFVEGLAKLGDVYVNDAFGTAHRAHASTAEITKFFPGKAVAGFLLEKEIRFLGEAVLSPKRPFYAIIGGAKISTKIGVLKSLLEKADKVLIGGGMAYTFFKAQGIPIGNSIHEDNLLEQAKDILQSAAKSKNKLLLPQDTVVAQKLENNVASKVVDSRKGIPEGYQGVDIGPKTIKKYIKTIQDAHTVFWNGPMGVFEIKEFAQGTNAIAHALAGLSKATTIVGGGESVAAVEAAGVADRLTHISTGGGASLEYIEFGTLPGIEALSDKR